MEETVMIYWIKFLDVLPGIGRSLLAAALIILGGRLLIRATGKMIQKAVAGKIGLDETLGSVLAIAVKYGIVIICAMMILENFGFNTTSLIALLGAAGVAIGLALKDTVSNIAAGIIILFLRPFQKGDFIESGSLTGTVKELGLFVSVIETGDGVYISVPNSNLWGPPLKNYTRSKNRRMDITVMISCRDPLDTAIEVLEEIGRGEKRLLETPAPQVVVQSVGEYGVTLILRAWASSDVFFSINQELTKRVKEKIEAAGLHPPTPRQEITARNG